MRDANSINTTQKKSVLNMELKWPKCPNEYFKNKIHLIELFFTFEKIYAPIFMGKKSLCAVGKDLYRVLNAK